MKHILSSFIGVLAITGSAVAQQTPAIRQLGPVVATAAETFNGPVFVRHSSQGVFVNDVTSRRLIMFDPALTKFSVIADTTPATASAYGGRTGGLIAYRGDSTLFVDAQSMSMLVIDPAGKVARVISVPRSQDAGVLGNPNMGAPSFDGKGRLVYRPMPRPNMAGMMGPGGNFTPPAPPESAAVVAVDLTSRQVDTLGYNLIPKIKMDIQRDDNGRMSFTAIANPLPTVDDWAVLSDGSIALIRGRDYHIDWIRPDGSRESTPKIPFEWRRLSDEDKVAFLDSVKAARERMMASAPAGGAPPGSVVVGGGGGGGDRGAAPGTGRQVPQRDGGQQIIIGGGGGGPGGPGAAGPGGPGAMRALNMVQPSELPDYQPVFFAGSARADADGNLWIRTIPTKALPGGPVYDVITAKGELVDRVQVPKDRTIVGFGARGVVYLAFRDGTTTKLEKATYTK